MNRHVLILGCSSRKHAVSGHGTMKAGLLYDGVMYRVIKAWQRRHPLCRDFQALILSAKYGLITWETLIGSYDQRMTRARAEQLLPQLEQRLPMMTEVTPENVYVELGNEYLLALPDLAILWPNATITYGHGRIGGRMQRLKKWLESVSESHRLESQCP